MKATVKNVCIALAFIAVALIALTIADSHKDVSVSNAGTDLVVVVLDLDGNPVVGATVTVLGKTAQSGAKGVTQSIDCSSATNGVDGSATDWLTANVTVKKSGFVPAIVFCCVLPKGQTRKLTVRMYPSDGSDLPYVCYVESPPDSYVKELLQIGK